MNKIILTTLPTVALHKLKIVLLLQIDTINTCVLSGDYTLSNNGSVFSFLNEKIFHLLQNKNNCNFDLILDDICFDILSIADQYFDTDIDEIEDDYYSTINNDYKINDSVIRYELKQLLNDVEVSYLKYNNKIKSLKLLLPDGVMFITEE